MEYLSSEQLLRYFEKEIHEASKKKIDELKKEIDAIKSAEIAKIDEDLKESISHDLDLQLKDLKTDHSYEMNKLLTENAKELMIRRQELFQSVFIEVKKKLLSFIHTDDYKKLLSSKIHKINPLFEQDEIIFYVKMDDSIIEEVLKHEYKGKYSIEKSPSIELGGFLAGCIKKGIELDETLDTILESKKQWFYEKSNLFIKK